MEGQGLLDECVLGTVKTLILEENNEVINLIERYFGHEFNIHELAKSLSKKAEQASFFIERP